MEWSGNFSKEEYLALAQDLTEEDAPGVVTLESFMFAAKNGAVCPPSRCREKGDENSNRSTLARDSLQKGNHGCHVSATPAARWVGQGRKRTRGEPTRGDWQSRHKSSMPDPLTSWAAFWLLLGFDTNAVLLRTPRTKTLLNQPVVGRCSERGKMLTLRHVDSVLPPPNHCCLERRSYPSSLTPPHFVDRLMQVDEFDDEAGDTRGLGARRARDAEGGVTATRDTLETTLQQAAVTARWVLFHRAPLSFAS